MCLYSVSILEPYTHNAQQYNILLVGPPPYILLWPLLDYFIELRCCFILYYTILFFLHTMVNYCVGRLIFFLKKIFNTRRRVCCFLWKAPQPRVLHEFMYNAFLYSCMRILYINKLCTSQNIKNKKNCWRFDSVAHSN